MYLTFRDPERLFSTPVLSPGAAPASARLMRRSGSRNERISGLLSEPGHSQSMRTEKVIVNVLAVLPDTKTLARARQAESPLHRSGTIRSWLAHPGHGRQSSSGLFILPVRQTEAIHDLGRRIFLTSSSSLYIWMDGFLVVWSS